MSAVDVEKTIIQNPTEEQRFEQEKEEFDVHEVYGIDVINSSGEGKLWRHSTATACSCTVISRVKASTCIYVVRYSRRGTL